MAGQKTDLVSTVIHNNERRPKCQMMSDSLSCLYKTCRQRGCLDPVVLLQHVSPFAVCSTKHWCTLSEFLTRTRKESDPFQSLSWHCEPPLWIIHQCSGHIFKERFTLEFTALWGHVRTALLTFPALDPVWAQTQGPDEKEVSQGEEELQDWMHRFLDQIT